MNKPYLYKYGIRGVVYEKLTYDELEYELTSTPKPKDKSKEKWKDNLFNQGKNFKQCKKFLCR